MSQFLSLFSVGCVQNLPSKYVPNLSLRPLSPSNRRLAQEREYSKLIDTANAPIFGVDNKGQVNVWNQCAMRLVGYSPEEVMGHSLVEEFITKDYQASVQMVLDQALTGKETANFEFPLRDEQGNVIGVVGIGQDITG